MIFTPHEDSLFFTVTSRYGGVSETPYDSLNLALHVSDNPKNVLANRTLVAQKHHFLIENLIYMDQTHSANIAIIKDCASNKIENCDALITNVKNIPLMVMVADCIPILLYDPVNQVIAVVHAGRNGTFNQIAKKTVLKMVDEFHCCASNVLVYLGTSIHKCCYEVGEEIVRIVPKKYCEKRDEKWYLDLQSMNVDQLLSLGVVRENIEIASVCTCCDKDYFSYRREGVTGRFAGIMKLNG